MLCNEDPCHGRSWTSAMAPSPRQAKKLSNQDRILEAFENCDNDTWMTCEDVVALAGAASGKPIRLNTANPVLYKPAFFLNRRGMRPGSTRKVTEFALRSKMACKGCKLSQSDNPQQEMKVCGCCMAVWHASCHKGKVKAALSGDKWFCSNQCAEEAAQKETPSTEGKTQKRNHHAEEEDEMPQRSAKKPKGAVVPPDGTTQQPQQPSVPSPRSARKGKGAGTVQPDKGQPEVRSRALSLPGCLCLLGSILQGLIRHAPASSSAEAIRAVHLSHAMPFPDAGAVGGNGEGHEAGGEGGVPPCKGNFRPDERPGLPTLRALQLPKRL